MNADDLKKQAAEAAIEYVKGGIIGVGTGSTVNHFIDFLAGIKGKIEGTVSSSEASTERLKAHAIPVLDLNAAGELDIYIDGADESDHYLNLIKGGGGALTREKIIAGASRKFVCIADASKLVDVLGTFPTPGGGHTHGPQPCCQAIGKVGRYPNLARRFYHRQWQPYPGCPQPGDHEAERDGECHQRHSWRGHNRYFCHARCRRTDFGHRTGGQNDITKIALA